jgi:hypothetical protein
VPTFQAYVYNWVLYFSGQVLMSMLPAFIVMDEESLENFKRNG